MKQENEKVVDLQEAQILESRLKGAYNINHKLIDGLTEKKFPLYWDLLLAMLVQTRKRMDAIGSEVGWAYSNRLAEATLSPEPIQQTRNTYSKMIPFYNMNNFTPFPESCLDIALDGSFEINEARLKEYTLNQNTYELAADVQMSIDAYSVAFEKSDISPLLISKCAYPDNGKFRINKMALLRALGCKPVGQQKKIA